MRKTAQTRSDRETQGPAAEPALQSKAAAGPVNDSPDGAAARRLVQMARQSPQARDLGTLVQRFAESSHAVAQRRTLDMIGAQTAQRAPMEEEEKPMQKMAEPVQRAADLEEETMPKQAKRASDAPAQLAGEAPKPNRTGLPDTLKSGIENLSGMSMDNVRVHYNSAQPAQLNALAYAQGTDIHVAPGQEKHLPHEAWHVVQQAQGRVKPTMQMKDGVPINDDRGLEREADEMGSHAYAAGGRTDETEIAQSIAKTQASQNVIANHYGTVKQLRNHTEITYQEGELNWRSTNGIAGVRHMPVGINTTALIDPEDPEQGERTGAPQNPSIYTTPPAGHYRAQNSGWNLTQGHLLNANLGGKARPYNLFPITREMNDAHSSLVEENVKYLVIDVMNQRNAEGSNAGGGVVAAALATSQGRTTNQVATAAADRAAVAAANAAALAINGPVFAGALGAPTPAALPAAALLAAGQPGANEATVASAVINAAAGIMGTPAGVVTVANAVAAVIPAVTAAIGGAVGAAGGAANAVAAAGLITVAIGAVPTPTGVGGTRTATPQDIARAVSTPSGVLPALGGGTNWDNVRVFYDVRVTAPGINGAATMRPNNLRQEQFHCTVYRTTNDGITRDMAGPFLNTTVSAPFNLNADLATLGFGPSVGPIPGLAVSAAVVGGGGIGGVGAQDAPSQHNVIDGLGNVVGHATLFMHH